MPPFFTSLPESLWPEVNRRLRLESALWELTAIKDVVAAFLDLGDDLVLWRPGQLGLAALGVFEPQSAADPFTWLKAAGRERLAKAYNALSTGVQLNAPTPGSHQPKDGQARDLPLLKEAKELPELVNATLAAVALHQRFTATHDLESIVADAA
ncbi:MAG: hypothetical protein AAB382_03430, partial [Chloroflexota bacterium]